MAARQVALRLTFDNARDPELELRLWPPPDRARLHRDTASDAIASARTWLSAVEPVLRRLGPPPATVHEEAEFEEDDEEPPWDEDEGLAL
jgi:hypothetical protein